ncbi:hypothetical protein F4818DRAFT_423135 [Hypoxylon cercidicola]|nr:hypothetical protein F4818DRAFT_423135 [Hypoxylon cercidicola]
MTDPLSIVGGISASCQIFGLMVDTVKVISRFCERYHDALCQFVRVSNRLIAIKQMLEKIL